MANQQVVLKSYVGVGNQPTPDHFEIRDIENPKLGPNEIRVQTLYSSVDPYLRFSMNPGENMVHPPFQLGQPIGASGCGKVVESTSSKYQVGDILTAQKKLEWPWQKYVVFTEEEAQSYTKLPADFPKNLISATVGWLGMPGLTAYFGLLERGRPQANNTVVVSGAAGATGSIVGQIAKLKGCRAIGLAGSEEKLQYLKDLGYDVAINYKGKTRDQLTEEIRAAAPNGVDIYYDNVGGEISNAIIPLVVEKGRIPICGQISNYNNEGAIDQLPAELEALVKERQIERGWFLVFQFISKYDEAWPQLVQWAKEGKLKCRETFYEGIENITTAFIGLFKGDNVGKAVVKLSDL